MDEKDLGVNVRSYVQPIDVLVKKQTLPAQTRALVMRMTIVQILIIIQKLITLMRTKKMISFKLVHRSMILLLIF